MKLSKSEAGKLGAAKSKEISEQKFRERVSAYESSPKQCAGCGNPLSYDKRKNKFCSSSCSATTNNALSSKGTNNQNARKPCLGCGNPVMRTYCGTSCQQLRRKGIITSLVEQGKAENASQVKRYLLEKNGNVCSHCNIKEWNGKPINMELEHIDGNSDNNTLENCCLICPNCHSQTPTYKARNKGNGRHYRRTRYAEGLSY